MHYNFRLGMQTILAVGILTLGSCGIAQSGDCDNVTVINASNCQINNNPGSNLPKKTEPGTNFEKHHVSKGRSVYKICNDTHNMANSRKIPLNTMMSSQSYDNVLYTLNNHYNPASNSCCKLNLTSSMTNQLNEGETIITGDQNINDLCYEYKTNYVLVERTDMMDGSYELQFFHLEPNEKSRHRQINPKNAPPQ